MNSLKAPSLSSLLSGTDRGSSDSLLGSINLDFDEVMSKFVFESQNLIFQINRSTIFQSLLKNSLHWML